MTVYVHEDVHQYLMNNENESITKLEEVSGMPLVFRSSPDLHHEQFEMYEY